MSHRTPNRLHSEAIREPFSPSTSPFERNVRARARTLFHPGESRIAYPAAIRRLYIRRFSSHVSRLTLAPLRPRLRYTRVISLCSSRRDDSIFVPLFQLLPGFRLPVVFFFSIGFLPGFLFPLFLLLFFLSASVFPPSPPVSRRSSFFFRCQSHSKRTSADYRSLPPARSHFPLCRLAGVRRV